MNQAPFQSLLSALPSDTALGVAEMEQLRREFDGDGFREVIGMFATEGESLLAGIDSAAGKHDADALRRAAHALRGAAANFGATRLVSLCQQVESSARDGNLSAACELLDAIHTEHTRVEMALQKECELSLVP